MQDEICQSREYTGDWTAPEWSSFSREFIQQTTNQDISLSCERFKKLIRQKQFRFSVPVTTYYRLLLFVNFQSIPHTMPE